MSTRLTASVVLEKTAYSFDKPYDYLVPVWAEDCCRAGCRVIVPFGKGNAERQGLVLSVSEAKDFTSLKEIRRVADETPILNDEMLKLCEWLHETLFCTYFDAVNAVLPTGVSIKLVDSYLPNGEFVNFDLLNDAERQVYDYIKSSPGEARADKILKDCDLRDTQVISGLIKKKAILKNVNAVQKMKEATLKSIRPLEKCSDSAFSLLTPRQREIAEVLYETGATPVKELQYFTGASISVINSLVSKGVAEFYEQTVYRKPQSAYRAAVPTDIVLTDEQTAVYNDLSKKLDSFNTALLYGVTGSGKTQIFLSLADKVIEAGRGVIIMVPEISLTPQTVAIFTARYGENIAVFHSAMSLGQRMDEWKRVKEGKAKIAIGTRSAIFAPFDNLGLIVMDEEQEHTYKSEQSPRFHTRNIARFRAKYNNALLLMASATPSVETYTDALSGKYSLCKLEHRYGNAVLPEAEVVDMRLELKNGNTGAISGVLYDEISNALDSGKQAIVLLNRRGHNTYISCPSCGYVATCSNCSVSMTYHSANRRLMCHCCGYSEPIFDKCPECEEEHIKFSGIGTQKVEEELKALFPDAAILRLDADTTSTKNSYSQHLGDFAEGKYDIMLGTQMVAKGLDFPNVTVVGVLGADKAMNSEDYRSAERTFSLLTQVIGRAGRGDASGKAIIQTQDPDNTIIPLAQMQDYDAFYNEEIMMRKAHIYPPFCDLVLVSAQSLSQQAARDTAFQILDNLKKYVADEYKDVKIIVLGPTPASVAKINNKYRYRLIIKCRNNKRTRELLRRSVDFKMMYDTSVSIDINPEVLI